MPKQQQVFGSSKTFRQKKKRKVNLVMPKYKHKLSQEKKIENYKKTELVERAPVLH
jgi:Neuraminidase (sialidase)